jgi:hypothetical protein
MSPPIYSGEEMKPGDPDMRIAVSEDSEGVYRAECSEPTFKFKEQIIFEFRVMSCAPALIREFVRAMDHGTWSSVEQDVSTVVPRLMGKDAFNNLRNAAAEMVVEFAVRMQSKVVIEPSAKFKKAMTCLMSIQDKGSKGLDTTIPHHLHEFMLEQFAELLLMMRSVRNGHAADHVADIVLSTIEHHNILIEEKPCAQSYLN